MTERTPWQADRDRAEATGQWPKAWGPFHRHFANDAVHRDGGPECDPPGTPRRVYVFDDDYLDEHERNVAAYAVQNPGEFADGESEQVTVLRHELDALLAVATLYEAAFEPDERMTLPGKLALQDVEAILAKYGRRY